MKSGPLTQRFGQKYLKKLTSTISNHCLSASNMYMNGQASFETARYTIRHELHSQSPTQFSYRTRGTNVAALTSEIQASHNFVAISSPECTSCEYSEPSVDYRLEFVLYEKEDTPKSTCKWLRSLKYETYEKCYWFSKMMLPINFKSAPSVLVFETNSRNMKVSKTLKFEQEGETVVLDVRGLISHGDFHFTSCVIGTDGMTTGSSCENAGIFTSSLPEIY
jgi:hypothetical protein